MEQRVSVITVGVADLARSRRFYEDGLGWRHWYVDDTVAFYQLNGLVLALFAMDAFVADANLPESQRGPGTIALAHNVGSREEVDALFARATEAGATVLKPAQEAEWGGYSGYFADPDGHAWEVAWNPGWPLDEAGNITLPDRTS